jgi:rhodanese-related sulfurtransferase/DNA-binding transcriptional ArsR family regulator
MAPTETTDRRFKDRLYGLFARIGKALANPHRIELLELLAQGERTVDSMAKETGLSLANASQHLQVLRDAGLVESHKRGLFVRYRLADAAVVDLCRGLRTAAERRLAEVDRLVGEHLGERRNSKGVSMEELLECMRRGSVVVLDTRPPGEFAAGHIAGAVSVPVGDIERLLRSLPKGKEYVAYCRGPYCLYADRAVEALRAHGRRARRLIEGFPDWKAKGFPIGIGEPVPAAQDQRREP